MWVDQRQRFVDSVELLEAIARLEAVKKEVEHTSSDYLEHVKSDR